MFWIGWSVEPRWYSLFFISKQVLKFLVIGQYVAKSTLLQRFDLHPVY